MLYYGEVQSYLRFAYHHGSREVQTSRARKVLPTPRFGNRLSHPSSHNVSESLLFLYIIIGSDIIVIEVAAIGIVHSSGISVLLQHRSILLLPQIIDHELDNLLEVLLVDIRILLKRLEVLLLILLLLALLLNLCRKRPLLC